MKRAKESRWYGLASKCEEFVRYSEVVAWTCIDIGLFTSFLKAEVAPIATETIKTSKPDASVLYYRWKAGKRSAFLLDRIKTAPESNKSRENHDVVGEIGSGNGDELIAKRHENQDGENKASRLRWAVPVGNNNDMLKLSKFSSCGLLPYLNDDIKLDMFGEDPFHPQS